MTFQKSESLTALISTIEPIDGGVPAMTRWICRELEELQITPILAWYAPWRNYPHLSIPSYKIFSREKPKIVRQVGFESYDSYGIGCWFPELEFTHYLPSNRWKTLVRKCDLHMTVSGNILCAFPYLKDQLPFLAWIATPWEADRKDRIRKFVPARRLLDAVVNAPILKRIEKNILNSSKAQVLCLSHYTSKELDKLSMVKDRNILYMPVNTRLFRPNISKTRPWRIGFSGRYTDPRKNIELLISAIRILIDGGDAVELILVGDRQADQIYHLIHSYGLKDYVKCYPHLSPSDLAPLLQSFDIFAIPSHQEGLCIAALEAMACGVPVVSTRCGGPEDYVHPGETGELVENNADAFALMIKSICIDRNKRDKLSNAAVQWIEANASENASRLRFRENLSSYCKKVDCRITSL